MPQKNSIIKLNWTSLCLCVPIYFVFVSGLLHWRCVASKNCVRTSKVKVTITFFFISQYQN
jgi:hypothetical protein